MLFKYIFNIFKQIMYSLFSDDHNEQTIQGALFYFVISNEFYTVDHTIDNIV